MLFQVFLNLLKKINVASVFYHTANTCLHFTLPSNPNECDCSLEKRGNNIRNQTLKMVLKMYFKQGLDIP